MDVTHETIVNKVSEFFSITEEQLINSTKRHHALPRWIAMYLCQRIKQHSLKQIGKNFKRDHSTVLSGVDNLIARMNIDKYLKLQVLELEGIIREDLSVKEPVQPPPPKLPTSVMWDFHGENIQPEGFT